MVQNAILQRDFRLDFSNSPPLAIRMLAMYIDLLFDNHPPSSKNKLHLLIKYVHAHMQCKIPCTVLSRLSFFSFQLCENIAPPSRSLQSQETFQTNSVEIPSVLSHHIRATLMSNPDLCLRIAYPAIL